jgi:hypothetical protein
MKLVRSICASRILPDLDQLSFKLAFSERGEAYYKAVSDLLPHDLSFAYFENDMPAAIIACNASSRGRLDRYGYPAEIWCDPELADDVLLKLSRMIGGELMAVAKEAGLDHISLRQPSHPRLAGYLAARFSALGHFPEASFPIAFSIEHDDPELLAACRSGHRQQIRAGMKNYVLEFMDTKCLDRTRFDAFQNLHAAVAGRITRPQKSWDRMFELVATGEGDLALTYLDGELLGGTLMLDAGNTSHYASGAYVRSHFDKPLAHYPLYSCLCRARDRGRARAHLGETSSSLLASSEKEKSIASFKVGFTSTVETSAVWTIPVQT